jgi:hypothetical protein
VYDSHLGPRYPNDPTLSAIEESFDQTQSDPLAAAGYDIKLFALHLNLFELLGKKHPELIAQDVAVD